MSVQAKHKLIDFVLLLAIFAVGLYGLYIFNHQKAIQICLSILMGVGYFYWGIYHHHSRGNLHDKIVLEYAAIAGLVVFILVIFLLRV
jgi:hypothetical protein